MEEEIPSGTQLLSKIYEKKNIKIIDLYKVK